MADQLTSNVASITANSNSITAHTSGTDPHGDRAYADTTKASISHTHSYPVTSVNTKTGAVVLVPADISAVAISSVGAANGVAGLDGTGLVPIAQLPIGTTSSTVALGNHTHAYLPSAGGALSGAVTLSAGSATPLVTITNTTSAPTSPTTLHVAQASGDATLGIQVTGDTVPRLSVDSAGKHAWGPGTGASDVSLARTGTGLLTVTGALALTGAFTLPGGTYRNQASATFTVANTTTETLLGSMTIPAAEPVVGATYRLTAWGVGSVTGTPTYTLRSKLASAIAGTSGLRTASSGIATHAWRVEVTMVCLTTGTGGTGHASSLFYETLSQSTGAPWSVTPLMDGGGTFAWNTTVSTVFGVSWQWGTASTLNTATCQGVIVERVS